MVGDLRDAVHHGGKAWLGGGEHAGHVVSTVRKQREMGDCAQLMVSFSFSPVPRHKMALSTFREGLFLLSQTSLDAARGVFPRGPQIQSS